MPQDLNDINRITAIGRRLLGAAALFWALILLLLGLLGTVGEGADSEWTLFLGRFHPLIVHLPIGALAVVAFIEAGRILTFGKWSPDVRPALGLAAISGVASIAAGFLLGQDSGYRQDLLNEHFWWGCGFGVFLCLAFVARLGRGKWSTIAYWAALALSLVSMTVAGHHGASLTHGETYLTDEAPPVVRDLLGLPERQVSARELAALEMEKPREEQVFYIAYARPILELRCYECHNAGKQKGQLRMDTYEALLRGGKEGSAVVPGASAESPIIQRVELPEYDKLHMPPTGHEPVSDYELGLLKVWIDTGASAIAKVAELDLPQEIFVKDKNQARAMARPELAKMLPDEQLLALQAELTSLSQKFPGAASLISRGGDSLSFNATVLNGLKPDDLQALAPFAGRLIDLNLGDTELSEQDFILIGSMHSLRSLYLNKAKFEDAWLGHLKGMPSLKVLSLFGTSVSVGSLKAFETAPSLETLYLGQTGILEADLESLQLSSQLKIVFGI